LQIKTPLEPSEYDLTNDTTTVKDVQHWKSKDDLVRRRSNTLSDVITTITTTTTGSSNDSDPQKTSICCVRIQAFTEPVNACLTVHSLTIRRVVYAILVAGYAAYFAYALNYEFGSESSIRLLWVTMTVVMCLFISLVRSRWGEQIEESVIEPPVTFIRQHWRIFKM